MLTLDTESSQAIVRHMAEVLGAPRVVEVLDVKQARFGAFLAGRGRLSEVQLNRIAARTRRTWVLWGMDAATAAATTPQAREWVASANELRDLHESWNDDEVAAAERWLARAAGRRPDAITRTSPRAAVKESITARSSEGKRLAAGERLPAGTGRSSSGSPSRRRKPAAVVAA